jgi:hypothetical protein
MNPIKLVAIVLAAGVLVSRPISVEKSFHQLDWRKQRNWKKVNSNQRLNMKNFKQLPK